MSDLVKWLKDPMKAWASMTASTSLDGYVRWLEVKSAKAADLIEQQAASLATKDAEIEKLREAAKGSLVVVQAAIAAREQTERAYHEEHNALTDVRNMMILCGELGGMQPGETMAGYLRRLIDALIVGRGALAEAVEVLRPVADVTLPWGDIGAGMIYARDVQTARAFIAEHGSDSKGE